MAEKLTPQQAQVVSDRGGNLLVSAAAGSGKTKVLTDRLISYLTDPVNPANIDDFLIITFTKAAAAELRVKIAGKLSEAIAAHPENLHLQRQMQRLHLAKISTVHSFCADILREYSYMLDISSDFRMVDMAECPELQQRVLEKVLNDVYLTIDTNESYRQFINTQGYGRNDRRISDIILKVYKSSCSHLDPAGWLDRCESSLNVDSYADLSDTIWGRYLIDDLKNFLQLQINTFENCIQKASLVAGMESATQLLTDTVSQLRALQNADSWEAIRTLSSVDFGTMRFANNCADKDLEDRLKLVRKECMKQIRAKLEVFNVDSQRSLTDLQECSLAARGLISMVRRFSEEYDRLKKSLRVMDFNDLEHAVLDLLLGKKRSAPTAVAKELGKRFREVMVDEYQDSNQVQDAIYHALTLEQHNCFMVGDVKQSIYQFRLADPEIFIEKYNSFVHADVATAGEDRKILLSKNFRSSGEIIDCVNDVFSYCMTQRVGGLDYGPEEMLYEGVPHISLGEPEVYFSAVDVKESTYDEESAYIAQEILTLLDGSHMVRQGEDLRPARPEDIAVLIRSRTILRYLTNALDAAGIPYTTNDGVDLLSSREISSLICLLRVISNPLQDIPLIAVLSGNVFHYTADELANLRTIDKDIPIFRLLQADPSEKSENFLRVLHELRQDAKVYPVSQLIENVLHKTGFDSVYAAMPDGEERVSNIQKFLQMASDFEATGVKNLTQFIEHIDAATQFGMETPEGDQKPGSVQITTIHKSKGLEYPIVFLMGLSRETNFKSARENVLCDRELGLGLTCMDVKQRIRYPSVSKRAVSAKIVADTISEEVRVLYVAMTRARDRLIMTYADNRLEAELKKISAYLDLFDRELLSRYTTCPGSWVLQAAMMRTEAGELFALGGNPGCAVVSQIPWEIHVVTAPDSVMRYCGLTKHKQTQLNIEQELSTSLSFRYPYAEATKIPSKQIATQIKGRRKDSEISEHTPAAIVGEKHYRKPSFLSGGVAGKEYGNAYHAIMQYIHYPSCKTVDGLRRELDRLVEDQLISALQRDLVSENKIVNFICSPLGERIIDSAKVLREFKFSILNDIEDGAVNEKILLQGVVDCMMIDPDGITVIDFKSDRFKPEELEKKKQEHKPQIDAYVNAVERIFKKQVKEKILYFFSIDEAVSL